MVIKPFQVFFSLCLYYEISKYYNIQDLIGSTDQKTFIYKMILNSKTICNCDMYKIENTKLKICMYINMHFMWST